MTCDRSSGARAGRPLTAQTGEDSNGTFGEYCSGIDTYGVFIPVQIERTVDRALLRQSSMAVVDLPATCDEVRGSEPKRAAAFPLSQGERVTAKRREADAGMR